MLLLLTATELSLGASSPYTSTDKTNKINIHKRNNTKNTVQTIQNTVQTIQNTVNTSTHITKTPAHYEKPTHTHTHILKNNLKRPQYKLRQTQYKVYPNGIVSTVKSGCFQMRKIFC